MPSDHPKAKLALPKKALPKKPEPPAGEDKPACDLSEDGGHEWSRHSTIPFCVGCGKLREDIEG